MSQLTLLEPEHGGPLDGRVALLHEAGQLLEEVELLLGVLLRQDRQQVLLDPVTHVVAPSLKLSNKYNDTSSLAFARL